MGLKWTDEQIAVRDAVASGASCKIVAYAGTGKTATAVLGAAANPRRGAYFAFNRAAAEDARLRFAGSAPDVAVSTLHAHAMARVGRAYRHRLQRGAWQFRTALRERHLGRLLRAAPSPGAADRLLFVVMDVLGSFQYSADAEICSAHLPSEFLIGGAPPGLAREVIDVSREAWADMRDPGGSLPVSHDTYFKIWQLSHPRIEADALYFDEVQDASPVMIDVFARQRGSQIVLIGDENQAIYQFRHASGALDRIDLPELPLTRSWRFGPEIAAIADLVLRAKGSRWPLVGAGPAGSAAIRGSRAPTAVLARSNAGLVDEALEHLGSGRRVAVLGGADAVSSMIEGAYDLWLVGRSAHPSFRLFAAWSELEEFARTPHGGSFRPFIRLVHRWRYGIPDLAHRLRTEIVAPESADVVLSTVHKFKGRESPVVRIAGDFPLFAEELGANAPRDGESPIVVEEANIAYVALTRAARELQVGPYYDQLKRSLEIVAARRGRGPLLGVEAPSSDAAVAVPDP